jgi:hypothetical protein
MKYRKKPVVIEAIQFRAGEQDGELAADVVAGRVRYTEEGTMLIQTLEGVMEAKPGDWIIRGIKGEIYPCKRDIFAATYEPAVETKTYADGTTATGTAPLPEASPSAFDPTSDFGEGYDKP